ncbi:MAG: DUF3795 domain-containing protein [Dehalococcoidia bacterium]
MKEELIAPCGMNCAICSAYLAYEGDIKNKGVKTPYCKGCRPRNKLCSFLKKRCDKLIQNSTTYCFECEEFPCGNLAHIDGRYKQLYRMSMIDNLLLIKDHSIEYLLETEARKWKCPQCGGTISCHNGICYSCGLEELRSRKKPYRWANE